MRTLALRLLRLVLRVYPRAFRARFGESMEETFALGIEESRAKGALGASSFALRAIVDVALEGLRERRDPTWAAPRVVTDSRPRSGFATRAGLLAKDVRQALRAFARRPGFTAVAVTTLALGIGASTAIFSIVHGVLLKPLPYAEPEGLVTVVALWSGPDAGLGAMSYPDLTDVEASTPSITSLVGISEGRMTLLGLGDAEVVTAASVTKGLLETFRTAPALGRDLRAEEFGPEGPEIAVIGHSFWQARFGGDPNVLGQSLDLNGVRREIVGVAPPGFDFPNQVSIWMPSRLDLEDCARGCHGMRTIGRMAEGATVESVQAELDVLAARLTEEYPDTNTHKAFYLRSLQEQTVGEVRRGLWVLLGAVGLVVLIVCANVANLLVARASSRMTETAIRAAMGASRLRLAAQTLLESSILSGLGALLGLGVAAAILAVVQRVATGIPRMENVGLDGTVVAVTFATAAVTALVFGLIPAGFQRNEHQGRGLRESVGRGGGGRRDRRLQELLLTTETALSIVLLVAAGLLLRSFGALYQVDLGYDPKEILRFSVILPDAEAETLDQVRAFYQEIEDGIEALPDVESVGVVWGPPLGRGRATGTVRVQGRPEPEPGDEMEAEIHSVGPGWMETMRIQVVDGRALNELDDRSEANAAVVNEQFVRDHFPTEDPLGQQVDVSVSVGYGSPKWTIVGVARDMHWQGLDQEPPAQILVPHGRFGPESMTVTVRLRPGAATGIAPIRDVVEGVRPDTPMYRVETMDAALARHVAPTRFYLVLLGGFAVLAAVLASVGLYGVASYAASERRFEIGLRYALGARRESILRLVASQGMAPALVGIALGVTAALFFGRAIESILFEVNARDPLVYGLSTVLLVAVALAATAAPAWRAARTDPARALRSD